MDISFQLYSAREFTPWDGVLKRLADLGYTQVEGFGGNYENPAAFRDMLDAQGLKMPSGHFFPMEQFEDDLAKVISTARTLGMERIFVPAVPPEQRIPDAAMWQSIAERLEAIGQKIRDAGLRFGWHNHDFEFNACADGRLPMDILMEVAPSIEWEADIAWIVRGTIPSFIQLAVIVAALRAIQVNLENNRRLLDLERVRKELATAELNSLKGQMQPHFIDVADLVIRKINDHGTNAISRFH